MNKDMEKIIQKNAFKFASNRTAPNEQYSFHELYTGYIAGANESWNDAIQKIIKEIDVIYRSEPTSMTAYSFKNIIDNKLESLKL